MDNTRPTPPGTVHATPEAGPITPPTMQDHFAQAAQGAGSAGTQATTTPEATVIRATAGSGGGETPPRPERAPEEAAHELGERLKPVLEAAEDVATKALDLTAKGLSKVVDMLEERRRHRDSSDNSESS